MTRDDVRVRLEPVGITRKSIENAITGVMASGGGTRPPRVAMRRTLPTKYFVIATDAIGNGLATSPSNSTARPRMKFPKYGIRDMVESQQRLLQHLGIARVVAVIGPSMGGMQTLQ